MTTLKTPLIASHDDLHDIAPLEVMFIGGSESGTLEHVTRVYPIEGLDAVWSAHGKGFYWLTGNVDHKTGIHFAAWEPHPDARFPGVRYF
jgi:hypothetical protein